VVAARSDREPAPVNGSIERVAGAWEVRLPVSRDEVEITKQVVETEELRLARRVVPTTARLATRVPRRAAGARQRGSRA
jgi:hypothetical protein